MKASSIAVTTICVAGFSSLAAAAEPGVTSLADIARIRDYRPQMVTLDDAPPKAASDDDLAKKLSNPVADLISLRFQMNFDFNAGKSNDAKDYTLNIQPVIPFRLSDEWNLITRTVLPVSYQEPLYEGQGYNSGLGDTTESMFFAPRYPTNGWIWGVGPKFNLPTATDTALGTGKWAAGPAAVLLQQQHGWTYGILADHLWSFCADADRNEINATFVQPFIYYQFPTRTTVGLSADSTFDWSQNQWSVPLNASISQLLRIGDQPVSFGLTGRYYAEGPAGGPEWGLRFTITFLFPK